MLCPTLKLDPFIHAAAITLTEAAQRIRGERRQGVNRAAAWRWATRGYRPRGWRGEPLRLPTVVIGSTRLLMRQWLEAWEAGRVEMGTAVAEAAGLRAERPRTERQAGAAHRRAVEQLRARGLKVAG